jgi:hypothetical protein
LQLSSRFAFWPKKVAFPPLFTSFCEDSTCYPRKKQARLTKNTYFFVSKPLGWLVSDKPRINLTKSQLGCLAHALRDTVREAVFSIPPRREMTLIFADFQHDFDHDVDNWQLKNWQGLFLNRYLLKILT